MKICLLFLTLLVLCFTILSVGVEQGKCDINGLISDVKEKSKGKSKLEEEIKKLVNEIDADAVDKADLKKSRG